MKKRSAPWILLGFSLVMSAGAAAQDEFGIDAGAAPDSGGGEEPAYFVGDRRFYVSPMFTYTFTDPDRDTHNGLGGTISVGKRLTWGLNLELTGTWTTMDPNVDGAPTAELQGVGLAALVSPLSSLPLAYGILAVHYGTGDTHPDTPATAGGLNYRTTIFDTGVGYMYPLAPWLGGFELFLRGEARYRMDAHTRPTLGQGDDRKASHDGVLNIGVLVPLGDVPSAIGSDVAVVEPSGPADADGDGVTDDVDQCPDTPAGTPVNDVGCEADSDMDGVVDRLDACPDTPAGTAVDEKGCSAAPQAAAPATGGCRQPAPGEPVTLEGCATGDAIVLRGVTFDFNSSRLTANARVILNQVADALIAAAGIQVELGGHTDSIGSDAYNQKLSLRRARAVHDYLVARGVAPSRMSAKGYGEVQPVASNDTEDGREINRRVEMKIVGGEGGAPAPAPEAAPAEAAPTEAAPTEPAPAEAEPMEPAPEEAPAMDEPAPPQ